MQASENKLDAHAKLLVLQRFIHLVRVHEIREPRVLQMVYGDRIAFLATVADRHLEHVASLTVLHVVRARPRGVLSKDALRRNSVNSKSRTQLDTISSRLF